MEHPWVWFGQKPIQTTRAPYTYFKMWVAPSARGRGLGDTLLKAAIHWAAQYGASCVKLGATCGNTPAIRLYQRAGFVELGATEPIRPGSAVLAQNMVLALAKSAV